MTENGPCCSKLDCLLIIKILKRVTNEQANHCKINKFHWVKLSFFYPSKSWMKLWYVLVFKTAVPDYVVQEKQLQVQYCYLKICSTPWIMF